SSCMGVAFSPDGRTAYLSGGNDGKIVLFDLARRRATGAISIDGEVAGKKYADSFTSDLLAARDGRRLFALDRANFRMVTIDLPGRRMPGLGSPLVPEAMSVWVVKLESGQVVAKHKPGYQIGQMVEGLEVVGGASPNSVAVGGRFAYVSNATNDNIAVIDTR